MNAMIALILIIPLVVALVAIVMLRMNLLSRFRTRPPAVGEQPTQSTKDPATGTTALVAVAPIRTRPGAIGRVLHTANNRHLRLGVAALLTIGVFSMVLMRVIATPVNDDFVVLVAPFQEQNGSITQTGRSAAESLVALLPQATNGRVQAHLVIEPPADEQSARTLLTKNSADVLIWGTISTGGLLDDVTLMPLLAYQPNGVYAPFVWDGYISRFAIPLQYRISNAPINAAVVLPRLLSAIADYGNNHPDSAHLLLSRLLSEYPALDHTLPNMLLGNLNWARGETPAAVDAYRRALVDADTQGSLPQAALLLNNLGAILQDAGDLTSRDAFNQAITLLNTSGADLGELRYNMARSAMAADDPAAALPSIEAARRLLPASSVLLLDTAEAMRANGQIRDPDADTTSTDEDALAVLARVERQIARDIDSVIPDVRQAQSNQLRADYVREQALVRLTRLIGLRGPLLWGMEARNDLNEQTLGQLRAALGEAVSLERDRARTWNIHAVAEDAAGRPIAGQIAAYQARLADQDMHDSQRWQAVIAAEIGESQNVRPQGGFAGFWAGLMGGNSPLSESKRTLEELVAQKPRDTELLVLLGHTLLARGDLQEATANFNTADTLAPNRPEALYGLAMVRLADNQADAAQRNADARALFNRAIERNQAFYPARIQLALLAENEADWPTALIQRRMLAAEQNSDTTLITLAHTLRLSGRDGYLEAEKLLLPLANRNNIQALIELSEIYRGASNLDAQRSVLEHAQRIAPRNVEVAYDLGIIALAQKDTTEAERQFRVALATNHEHVPSLLAMANLNMAKPSVAADYYRQALAAGANDVPTLKSIGSTMAAAAQDELALNAYEQAQKYAPDDAEIAYYIAQANLHIGSLDKADKAAQRALELHQGAYPEVQVVLGDIALARNQPDQARAQYESALRANSNLATAHIGLGRSIAAKGEWSVAAGHFRNAVSLNPNQPDARLWLAEALIRQNDPTSALEQYQIALILRPAYPEALFGTAQAQMALGQLTDAETNLAAAISARPKYAEAFLLRGKLYEQTEQDRKALAAYEEAIAANTQLPEPHYRRALLLIQRNRLEDARGDLNAALKSQPVFPEANYWIGRIEFAQAHYQDALTRFQSAVDQASGIYPEARFYQGLTEEQIGLRDAAIQSFRTTLSQSETGPWAGEARAALNRLGAQ